MDIKFFEGEHFNYVRGTIRAYTDEDINKRYISGEIRIITEQGRYPLEVIAHLFSNKSQYDDCASYQRKYVWNIIQKSRLIESFIMNIPIPPIFLYEQAFNKYEVLDGKQRISSIVGFYNNEFALDGLEVWKELNGKYYNDLPDLIKDGLNRRYLSSVIMLNESVTDQFAVSYLKRMVFERINTGGMHLTTQEARNAIFDGPFNRKVNDLANYTKFKEIWNFSPKYANLFELSDFEVDTIRNVDSELVLRFFAFRHIDNFDTNLNLFLDEYLSKANHYDVELIEKLSNLFKETIDFAYELFDGHPFTIIGNDGKFSNKPLRTIYDPLMQVLSQYLEKKDKILENKISILSNYKDIVSGQAFNGKLQDRNSIRKRIDIFDNMFKRVF